MARWLAMPSATTLPIQAGFRLTMVSIGLGIFMVLLLKRPKPAAGGAPSGAH